MARLRRADLARRGVCRLVVVFPVRLDEHAFADGRPFVYSTTVGRCGARSAAEIAHGCFEPDVICGVGASGETGYRRCSRRTRGIYGPQHRTPATDVPPDDRAR